MAILTRIIHDEHELMVLEEPGDVRGYRIKFLAHPDNSEFVEPGTSASHSGEHGSWCQIASVEDQQITPSNQKAAGRRDLLTLMTRRYRQDRARRVRSAADSCFFLVSEDRAVHSIRDAQLGGLLVRLFRSRDDARRAARELDRPARLRRTGALRDFLAQRAAEGYAGALLDDLEPIYWCMDVNQTCHFMKLQPGGDGKSIVEHVLDEQGVWSLYDGELTLELFEDQKAWDERMVQDLGQIPWLGYHGEEDLYAVYHEEEPLVLSAEESDQEPSFIALFFDPSDGRDFIENLDLKDGQLREVIDLKELLTTAQDHGALARLHPGGHRSKNGLLWLDNQRVVLDTFSGLWGSADGRDFSLLA